jgi:Arb2 domain
MNSGSSSYLRVDSIYQRINSVISFVAENPVRAIASHTQAWLSRWYKDVSSFPHFVLLFPLTSGYYFVPRRALPREAGNILRVDLVYRTPLSTSPINTVCGIILRVDDGHRSATVAYYNRRKLDSTRCWFTIKLMSLIGSQAELLQRRAVYPRVERKKIVGPPSRLRANPDQLKFPVCRVPSVPILP